MAVQSPSAGPASPLTGRKWTASNTTHSSGSESRSQQSPSALAVPPRTKHLSGSKAYPSSSLFHLGSIQSWCFDSKPPPPVSSVLHTSKMAAQQGATPQAAGDDLWMTDIDTDDEGESTSDDTFLIIVESPTATTSISSNDGSAGPPPPPGPPNGPFSGDSSYPFRQKYGWTTQTYTSATNTPLAEHAPSMSQMTTVTSDGSGPPPPPQATNQAGIQRPGGPWQHKQSNGGLIAVAAIVPIVALIVIGVAAFCFLRRRKRNQQAASRMTAEEMKQQAHPAPSIRPYMATNIPMPPPFEAARSLPPSTHDLSTPAPVILGPISSGAHGAYQTGIDTSDMISIVSSDARPVDPFADPEAGISEPPPPYRPNSVAPPSFVSTSRQSSVRTIGPPPATSQTHLIERSPFDDPPEHEANVADDNDDAISELSGPTLRRSMDAMSAVSDLSYQNEPVIGRTSL